MTPAFIFGMIDGRLYGEDAINPFAIEKDEWGEWLNGWLEAMDTPQPNKD